MRCPTCQMVSTSMHSHYPRTVTDVPVGSRPVTLAVQVRRFRCRTPACSRQTFAEDFALLVRRSGRRTIVLQELLDDIGITVGGRPGARFARRHRLRTSRSMLIRLVRQLPLPLAPPPLAPPPVGLGVDDFAMRRNHHYGTLGIVMLAYTFLLLQSVGPAVPVAPGAGAAFPPARQIRLPACHRQVPVLLVHDLVLWRIETEQVKAFRPRRNEQSSIS